MESEKVSPQYQKGFNHGYQLQRENNPHFNEAIKGSASYLDYQNGLKGGQAEAQREAFRERRSQAKDLQQKDKNKDRGVDMG